jgi:hypothetical protein
MMKKSEEDDEGTMKDARAKDKTDAKTVATCSPLLQIRSIRGSHLAAAKPCPSHALGSHASQAKLFTVSLSLPSIFLA